MTEKTGTGKSWRSVWNILEQFEHGINIFQKTWNGNLVIESLDIWIFELWNFETKQPKAKKPRNEETKVPRTPHQHTDSHACTRRISRRARANLWDTRGRDILLPTEVKHMVLTHWTNWNGWANIHCLQETLKMNNKSQLYSWALADRRPRRNACAISILLNVSHFLLCLFVCDHEQNTNKIHENKHNICWLCFCI